MDSSQRSLNGDGGGGSGAGGGDDGGGGGTGRPAGKRPRVAGWTALVRLATWGVLKTRRRMERSVGRGWLRWWGGLRPEQQVVLGFASYVLLGTLLLLTPWAREAGAPGSWLDHLFTATSAVSTTGLSTVSVGDTYSFLGEAVILCLFQLGGLGYMTLSSLILLARGKPMSAGRTGVLRAEFSIPHYFNIAHFVRQIALFTLVVEGVGALILWWRFSALGVENPLWWGVFHSVSAFATAGFSLSSTSLEPFVGDPIVNITVGVLCTLGAVGFIVFQDVWYSLRLRERMITFTTKVILLMTGAIFAGGTVALALGEPTLRALPWEQQWSRAAFQVMSASSTAGFNSVPIGALHPASLSVLIVLMLVGASPAGTGGGIKTTAVSALVANALSVARRREAPALLGHAVPLARVLAAAGVAVLYLTLLAAGVTLLAATQDADFLALVFEAASAIGTVGLSTGITTSLDDAGKVIVVLLMFAGRCGVLTLGLATLSPAGREERLRSDDLAI